MRKVIIYMVISVDGFVCGPNNELDWEIQDPEVSMYLIPKLFDRVDTMLLGRELYKGFEQTWPAMAKDPNTPSPIVDFAGWVEQTPKIVFSDTLEDVTWANSQLINIKSDQDIADEVTKLKQQDGKDMVVFGGARFAQTLTKLGLVDEFQFKLQPIALGQGKPLFGDLKQRQNLKLIESKAFKSGVVTLAYE